MAKESYPKYNEATKCYDFNDIIYFDKTGGALTTQRCIDDGYYDEDDENLKACVKFRLKIAIPAKVFEPYTLHIEIPEAFIADNACEPSVEAIEVPITLEDNVSANIKVTETVKRGKIANILYLVREAIAEEFAEKKKKKSSKKDSVNTEADQSM